MVTAGSSNRKKDDEIFNQKEEEPKIDLKLMGAGVLIACSFFIFGGLVSKFIAIPGAILMIIAAAAVKYAKLLPASMEKGAHQLYKFMSSSFTWPLMVGLGILYIPLDDVASVISLRFIAVCASVVIAMVTSGYFVGKLMNMYLLNQRLSPAVTAVSAVRGTWLFFRLQAGWG